MRRDQRDLGISREHIGFRQLELTADEVGAGAAGAFEPFGDVRGPLPSGDVAVEAGIAVDEDVEAGELLLDHISHYRVEVLLANGRSPSPSENVRSSKLAVYQDGRGSDPVIVVASGLSLVAM